MEYPDGIRISFVPDKGQALLAMKHFKKGETLFEFIGVKKDFVVANKKSLQVGSRTFLESTKIFDDYLNHSCEPNAFIRFGRKVKLKALRDIQSGEELSFDYNTTEFDMVAFGDSFSCHCGSYHCQGYIRGYYYLTFEQKENLESFFAPYLKRKFALEKRTLTLPVQTPVRQVLPFKRAFSTA